MENARPPCSCAFSASCSVIVDAIQVASRCDARPVRAVTRPPPPRFIDPSSWKVTGPRLETRTRGGALTPTNLPRVVGSLGQLDLHGAPLAVADQDDGHGVARRQARDHAAELVRLVQLDARELDD